MKTMEVQIPFVIPNGFEVDSFDLKSLKLKLKEKPKDVKERIKTVDDLLADHGYTQERFDQLSKDLSSDEKAYRLLKLLTLSLNEGWFPDWDNSSQPKYYAWFYMGGSSGFRFLDYVVWALVFGCRLSPLLQKQRASNARRETLHRSL